MKINRKKRILPMLILLIGTFSWLFIFSYARSNQRANRTENAKLNAMTYAERMKTEFQEGISATETLEKIVLSEDGEVNHFYEVARGMMTESTQSIQIAPGGVVTDIYPAEGNEAGKIDLIHDQARGELSRYARDHHVKTMQGPFALKQGGYGIAVRNPVYLTDENGQENFWGFTIVIIRVPEIFSNSLQALSQFGYDFALLKTTAPDSKEFEEIYKNCDDTEDMTSYTFSLCNNEWMLKVRPAGGWQSSKEVWLTFWGGAVIVILLSFLTGAMVRLEEHQERFRNLAVRDSLTGIYNREGFTEEVTKWLEHHGEDPFALAEFDIDEFKFINDMYGHATGDHALISVAESMRKLFPEDAVLGRIGGDEFCIFLKNTDARTAQKLLKQYTKTEKYFVYGEEKKAFEISLGYARYPAHARDYKKLLACADLALYTVKQQGKNGCMEYAEGMKKEVRNSLGFAIRDVSENLPAAFIIYKAGKEDDELLFANQEFLKLAGVDSMEELMAYTKGSFRNLIREDERLQVEQNIWKQIEEGYFNDYVYYHLKKADGSYVYVLDHGRIVENERYGKVFYVLFMDWNFLKMHYNV